MRALSIAATGMSAQQTNVEVIANNVANINTTGFKRARAEFTDLLYQADRAAGTLARDDETMIPEGNQLGLGVRTVAIRHLSMQGALSPTSNKLDLALWLRGWTPNYHVQVSIYPAAVNVPIACGGVTVIPGDIIMADDDGVIVLPPSMAEQVIEDSRKHAEWEVFSREKLKQGADLRRYYPLHPDAEDEYAAWRKLNPVKP